MKFKSLLIWMIVLIPVFLLSSSIITVSTYDTNWNYKYENLSKQVAVYEVVLIQVAEVIAKNGTIYPAYNYTIHNLTGYKTEYYNGERIGVKVGDKNIDNKNVNVNKGMLYECSFDVGDRNWEEFPMRQYEIDKGFCSYRNLTEVASLALL